MKMAEHEVMRKEYRREDLSTQLRGGDAIYPPKKKNSRWLITTPFLLLTNNQFMIYRSTSYDLQDGSASLFYIILIKDWL
ncbi:MAG: hypothetical protein A2V93_00705 [Ignavibacteria bacterium RBG_16_34_14]|nr:MAG: hypothetical protein A2V93_00705 [Ignavibacteria bacterium RBG_16_34_14]